MILGALGLLCKLGRRPNLAGQAFFVSSLARPHDANQSARGIFHSLGFPPVLFAHNHANTRAWRWSHVVQRNRAKGAGNYE